MREMMRRVARLEHSRAPAVPDLVVVKQQEGETTREAVARVVGPDGARPGQLVVVIRSFADLCGRSPAA